eukprot:TRINITY_DN13949_c0_g1_i9.p1 TRINITY_DN13949_c0_g1~~TRINITY_DN13949_c0_g1_i9.p1  ORF type:complete len:116 (+),score=37.91 TRINITY_DN13949_c0_g1_i9:57-404(+)
MLFIACCLKFFFFFFFQAEDGIRDAQESRGLGDVYKRQVLDQAAKIVSSARWYNRAEEHLTRIAEVNLYDLVDNLVVPATRSRECSMVELVASDEQPPHYFVSQCVPSPMAMQTY